MIAPVVLFHDSCNDGHTAAWVARKKLPDATFLPVQYGRPLPYEECRGARVFMLDFCPDTVEDLRRLLDASSELLVLDHHKTAEATLAACQLPGKAGRFKSVWDGSKSGARLAWEWFFPGEPAPWLVEYAEDRDLWAWKLPLSREVSAGLQSYPMTFEQWDSFDRWNFRLLATDGAAILRYQAQLIDRICKNAREKDIGGHKILAVNNGTLISEVAGKLAEGRPFGACWFEAEGKTVWSLRSAKDGIDVSEVAKSFGGGGHRNAAGFTLATAPAPA